MVPVSNIRSNFLKIHPSSSYRQSFAATGFCWFHCDFSISHIYLFVLMLESSTVRDPPSSGCHHRLPATSESLGYLDPSGEGQVSRSEWGNLAVLRVGIFDFKDRTGQITLEKKSTPRLVGSWKMILFERG